MIPGRRSYETAPGRNSESSRGGLQALSVESAAGSNQVSDLLDGGEGVGNVAFERGLYVFLDPLKTFSVDGAAADGWGSSRISG
jgi:hypothetical protein